MRLPPRPPQDTLDAPLTPLIDVVFLLLIFFVVASAAPRAEETLPTPLASGIAASLPAELRPLGEVLVRLSHTPLGTRAAVNAAPASSLEDLEALLGELRQAGAAAELPVVIDAAPDVPVGDVIRAYDAAVRGGFASVHFATGSPGE